jgi:hypothetical protein
MRWLVVLVACAACRGSSDAPAPGADSRPVMAASEVKRSQDACKAYVDQVCRCAETVPAMKQACGLARALPDAIQVGLDVAGNADTSRREVLQVHDSVRKIVKQCIEETAKLPAAGCP